MQVSEAGLNRTMAREGVRLRAYQDRRGIWTIGVGHTGMAQNAPVQPGQTVTMDDAMAMFRADADWATAAVNQYVEVPLDQNQFDALFDFVFNVGIGQFRSSTLLRLLNAGDYAGADAQFQQWNLCDGRVLQGLVDRRDEEATYFKE